jgi:hypothetical protein
MPVLNLSATTLAYFDSSNSDSEKEILNVAV